MIKSILIAAITTGVFCAGFALVVDYFTDMLQLWQVAGLAWVSGFSGSLFASVILGRRR